MQNPADRATARQLERDLKEDCPYDTGALQRSITVTAEDGFFVVSMLDYGYIQNEGGASGDNYNKGWIDDIVPANLAPSVIYIEEAS